jgi:flagellar biosynthesis protein FlhF
MEVKTYRAKTMQEAIRLIRNELGPEAAVLHTREVPSGLFPWLTGSTELEVTASNEVPVPSRVNIDAWRKKGLTETHQTKRESNAAEANHAAMPVNRLRLVLGETEADTLGANDSEPVEKAVPRKLRPRAKHEAQSPIAPFKQDPLSHGDEDPIGHLLSKSPGASVSAGFAPLFASLMANEVDEPLARKLIQLLDEPTLDRQPVNLARLRGELIGAMSDQLNIQGPIQLTPGRCRVAAMVGPTGVGKTTTIAKIAANMRLRDNRRVGLLTVDTYRIAAVEQLRTYAEIIDLPMEVVSSPREMRAAIQRMRGLDCVLIDTAGRSPREEIQLHELRAMLSEASADEVHLVLSCTSGTEYLQRVLPRYECVHPTALILSKLDEAEGLASLYPFLAQQKLGLSYLTTGQSVPGDIQVADPLSLAKTMITRT